MARLSPVWRLLGGALLLVCILTPTSSAQAPITNPQGSAVGFAFTCQDTLLAVNYQGSASTTCQLQDFSRDTVYTAPGQSGVGATQHTTRLTLGTQSPANAQGWKVILGNAFISTYGGDVVEVPLTLQTTPQINTPYYGVDILVNYTGPNGVQLNETVRFSGQVNRYDIAHIETLDRLHTSGQAKVVKYTLAVTNDGVYPDIYGFEVRAPPGFEVTTPPGIYVLPGQTRNTTFEVLTPHDKLYDLGTSVAFVFTARSELGTGVYTDVGILKVVGAYVPTYWIPLTLVGLISAVIVTKKSRERMEIRRLESGRPRRVPLSPRQLVLLEELKRTDPEAYKERRAQLEGVYVGRRSQYKGTRKEQLARDAEERKVARAEFRAQKKRRAEQRKADKVRLKAERSAAKREAKAAGKEQRAKEKELKAKRKELGKAQKKQAKVDAKQAKVDAKQAAADAKRAAAEAKAQAKADKAAAKAAKQAEREARKEQ